jgi:ADP-ribosylglycohydrolase
MKRPRVKGSGGRTLDEFDRPTKHAASGPTSRGIPEVGRYQAALLYSAVGDAIGWPTEFLTKDRLGTQKFEYPVTDFVEWDKTVGGRWWGYVDTIHQGDYSDDTQLTLSVARSITDAGRFEPERFAYLELPLWLHYERGGGRSIKAAARSLVSKDRLYLSNFYKAGGVRYWRAGANGAAMRNLPIALVAGGDEKRLIRDSFLNALITHGHPRGIIGSVLYGLALQHVLSSKPGDARGDLLDYISNGLEHSWRVANQDFRIRDWVSRWDASVDDRSISLKPLYQNSVAEAQRYLSMIPAALGRPHRRYYEDVGALAPESKGSGIATTSVAVFLFLSDEENSAETLYSAVNELGSDTDTISGFWAALSGAERGLRVIPTNLARRVQDRAYLVETASRLHRIATGEIVDSFSDEQTVDKSEAYNLLLAWEIGLHEMFWDAIQEGGEVVHPTLGRGTIRTKEEKEIPRRGYVVKILNVAFDCGQTARFHSRLENHVRVTESLSEEILKAIRGESGDPDRTSEPADTFTG